MSSTAEAPDQAALRRRVMRKVAVRLSPFLILLYFVNYLDRTNISFAAPHGMNEALGFSKAGFGLASGLFFIGYLVLEVPSNLALHRFGARRWLARIMVSWGVVASVMAFAPNAGTMYLLRFVLGIAEAGFFPGIILYLTFWFPQRERAKAVAFFMLAVPLSSMIGSPLSGWLISIGHDVLFGLAGWRFMFLVEGLPAIVVGVVCWFYLTDRPSQARWLAADERDWLQREMDAEQAETGRRYHFPLRRALTNPRVLALAFVYFGIVYGLYAVGFFLPTIIAGFQDTFHTSYTVFQQGLIVAVPYAFGCVAMLVWARHGDRTGERVWHVAIPAVVGGVAIPVALYLHSPFAVMIAVTVCTMGICAALPTFWPLPTMFLTGAAAAGGIALVNSLGNLAGFAGPYVTGWLTDATGTEKAGLWVVGAFMVAAGVVAVALRPAPAPDDAAG
ncbi:MFS transporter [Actinocatenispora comari]|uniref:Putative tartrate transporter n=1 Tax=Actinocatenispora comari TaxID=2807577 RepID=A0A8J4A8B2_9ACTN|nr:MFS transporter [Actinocatenispora comari]GIL25175.1 MFS transporter [Actinocatenispora comari]